MITRLRVRLRHPVFSRVCMADGLPHCHQCPYQAGAPAILPWKVLMEPHLHRSLPAVQGKGDPLIVFTIFNVAADPRIHVPIALI